MIPLVFASRETLYSSISALHFRVIGAKKQLRSTVGVPRDQPTLIKAEKCAWRPPLVWYHQSEKPTAFVVEDMCTLRTKMVAILRRIMLVSSFNLKRCMLGAPKHY